MLCFSAETRALGCVLVFGLFGFVLAPSLRLQFVCWCLGLFVAKDFVVFRLGLCSRLNWSVVLLVVQ